MRAFLLILLLLAAGVSTALAETAGQCLTPDRVIEIEAINDPGAAPEYLEGKQAAAIRDGIESFYGTQLPVASTFLIFSVPGAPVVHLVAFQNRCAVTHGMAPAQLVRAWRGLAS